MSVKRGEQSDTKTARSTCECHVSQTLNVTKHDFKEHWSLIWCDCQWPWSLMPLIVKGLMYITPAKACVNADVVRSEPYMWASCEERKGNVGWKRIFGPCQWRDYLGEEWDLHLAWTLVDTTESVGVATWLYGLRTMNIASFQEKAIDLTPRVLVWSVGMVLEMC